MRGQKGSKKNTVVGWVPDLECADGDGMVRNT